MDMNIAAPKYDVVNWNEIRWNGCWNPDAGVGLYLHAGRYRPDLDMWWAQVVAYLPDRELCVTRFHARNTSDRGVSAGGLELAMTETGWTASFDGVGELTTMDAMALTTRGSSSPLRPMRFDVTATDLAPVYDMYAGVQGRLDHAGDMHIQQSFTTTGTLTIAGASYPLDGIGFKDHSSGPRDFGRWHGHRFFVIITDTWACHAVVMYTPDGEPTAPWGKLMRDGEQLTVTRFELPFLQDSAGGPINGELELEIETGETFTFQSELVHAAPMLMTQDNDYTNGVDWDLDPEPIVLIEGKGRLVAPDGTIAHCFHERSARRGLISRPTRATARMTA